tara:strand:- start:1233 stop:1823 length:591 start_codon:yes stop_codon:yes gene_type:complete
METTKNILFIDLETSGLPERLGFDKYYSPTKTSKYNKCRIIEIAYIIHSVVDNCVIKEYSKLIIPDKFIINNSRFHGITNEMCEKDGITMNEMLDIFTDDIKKYNVGNIVSHNIKFDFNILLSEMYRYNYNELYNKCSSYNIECTMKKGKYLMNTYKYPKLTELYYYLFNKNYSQTHRALDDVKICYKCFIKISEN